jgi:acyl-CoA reductase-like NAD-dependent aldehyde dehydrogenase
MVNLLPGRAMPGLMSPTRQRKRCSRIPDGTAEDARKAIDAADKAQPAWEALPAIERAGWLRKIAAGIRARASEISALIVAEGGKIQQLAEVEVNFTADYIDYMSEWARRYEGEISKATVPAKISLSSNVRWALPPGSCRGTSRSS